MVHGIEGMKELAWHGHGAEDASAALLKTLDDNDTCGDIDASSRQGEAFRDPAAGMCQGSTEREDVALGALRRAEEVPPLGRREVLAQPGNVEKLDHER